MFAVDSVSAGNYILIAEVGAVLISILAIAWKGGSITSQLRVEQKEMQKMIAETKARVETIQSVEIERMRTQISTLQTALAVVQAARAVSPIAPT